jgi:hypothetical protein
MQAVVWLGTAVVAAVVSWATLRMHGDTPPPSAALPPVAVVEPMRSASDAAIAAAAVDSVRDQALFLRSLIARAADDEPSATSLREGREKFVAAIQGLPIELRKV